MKRVDADSWTYPRSRLATFDVGRLSRRKHRISAMLEVDVTRARELIREGVRAGRSVGLMAWIMKAVAVSIRNHPEVAAMNTRGRRQVAFRDVDIALPLERSIDGRRVPITTLLRGVQDKSVDAIGTEIRDAASRAVDSAADYMPAERRRRRAEQVYFFLPAALRRAVWRLILRSPESRRRNMGTAVITNVGMRGATPAWILPRSIHNLCVAVGTLTRKPWNVRGAVEIRDVLHITLVFDHDVVDGAPAARFADELVRNMESAVGLVQ